MSTTVSVIIPVFNGAGFIARAIDSVLKQTHRPDEIIVIDDASTDGTLAVLAPFSQHIKLIALAVNRGAAHARNVGMQASSGSLLAFLDADDVWRHDKLARQIAALNAQGTAGFCCTDFRVLNRHRGRMVSHLASYYRAGVAPSQPAIIPSLRTLIAFNFVGTSTVLLRRTVVQQVGLFNTDFAQAEDFEYWLRCVQATQFLVLPPVLVDKMTHASNLTNDALETFQCHERVLRALVAAHPEWDLDALGLPRAQARVHYEIAHQLFNRQGHRAAFGAYLRGLRSETSIANLLTFLYLVLKKTIRLASFGLIRRRDHESLRKHAPNSQT